MINTINELKSKLKSGSVVSDVEKEKYLSELCDLLKITNSPELGIYSSQLCEVTTDQKRKIKSKYWSALSLRFEGKTDKSVNELLNLAKLSNAFPETGSDIYAELGYNYHLKSDNQKALESLDTAIEIATSIKYISALGTAHNIKGLIGLNTGNYKNALKEFKTALKYRQQINDEFGIANTLNNIGLIYVDEGDIDIGLSYTINALDKRKEINDKFGMAMSYNNLGIIHFYKTDYKKSLEYHLKSLKLKQEVKDLYGESASYMNIANAYQEMALYKEAIDFQLKALDLNNKLKTKRAVSTSLLNIGNIYYLMGNYEMAMEYQLQALEIKKEINDRKEIALVMNNIAYINNSQQNYKEAIIFFNDSLNIKYKINDKQGLIESLLGLSESHFELLENNHSLKYLSEAIELNNEFKSVQFEIRSLIISAKIEADKGNYHQAESILNNASVLTKKTLRESDYVEIMKLLSAVYEKSGNTSKALECMKQFYNTEKIILNNETAQYIESIKYTAELEKKKIEAEVEQLKNIELKKAYENLERTHQELKEAQDELIRKERMAAIGKIASEIAHEVQNPLNFVNNFSELNKEIAEELKTVLSNINHSLPDEAKELLHSLLQNSESINFNGKRASGIVSQLLELTRKGEIHNP
jgi:two-component system, NtrC family, sensor kinase